MLLWLVYLAERPQRSLNELSSDILCYGFVCKNYRLNNEIMEWMAIWANQFQRCFVYNGFYHTWSSYMFVAE